MGGIKRGWKNEITTLLVLVLIVVSLSGCWKEVNNEADKKQEQEKI